MAPKNRVIIDTDPGENTQRKIKTYSEAEFQIRYR